MEFQLSYVKSWKMMLWKYCTVLCFSPGVLKSMGSQRASHDWETDMIWIELRIRKISDANLVSQLGQRVSLGISEAMGAPCAGRVWGDRRLQARNSPRCVGFSAGPAGIASRFKPPVWALSTAIVFCHFVGTPAPTTMQCFSTGTLIEYGFRLSRWVVG